MFEYQNEGLKELNTIKLKQLREEAQTRRALREARQDQSKDAPKQGFARQLLRNLRA